MGALLGLPDEMDPFLNQPLTCLVRRMRLAGKHDLYWFTHSLWLTLVLDAFSRYRTLHR
jgi:hypothetical protein